MNGVDFMTICRNADGEFSIISDVSGSVLYRESELDFLKKALNHLENEIAEMHRKNNEFSSSNKFD